MVSPLGCIFGIVITGFLFLFIIILNIILKVKGVFSAFKRKGTQWQNNGRQQNSQNNQTTNTSKSSNKKLFDDSEGEYIEFEEIK